MDLSAVPWAVSWAVPLDSSAVQWAVSWAELKADSKADLRAAPLDSWVALSAVLWAVQKAVRWAAKWAVQKADSKAELRAAPLDLSAVPWAES